MVKKKPVEIEYEQEDMVIDTDEPCFPTSVVSKLLDISVWTLKQLDRAGIVSPPRNEGQARLYSKNELITIKHCCYYMKVHKVNISGLKVILKIEKDKRTN